jgi:hypothetical protein
VENAISITVRALEELFDFLRESGLDSIARSWEFIDDAVDVASDIASTNPKERNQAAARLAEITKPSKQGKRSKLYLERLREEARAARMSPSDYLDKILVPGGVILATARMDSLQPIRLGRKWITGNDGKLQRLRPAHDLTVAGFIRWVYQQGNRASIETLMETSREKVPAPIITADDDPVQDQIIAAEATEKAKSQLAALLKKESPRVRTLLTQALKRDGELVTLLRELGYKPAAIRKMREQMRKSFQQKK